MNWSNGARNAMIRRLRQLDPAGWLPRTRDPFRGRATATKERFGIHPSAGSSGESGDSGAECGPGQPRRPGPQPRSMKVGSTRPRASRSDYREMRSNGGNSASAQFGQRTPSRTSL